MFYISESNFIRTLRPFSNLADPTDTIYDHLPYKKDINLVKESDVRLVSGNVVKYIQLVDEEPVIIDTNELAESLIEDEIHLYKLEKARLEREKQLLDDVKESEALVIDEDFTNEIAAEELDLESIKVLASVDENEDDYSFLNDD